MFAIFCCNITAMWKIKKVIIMLQLYIRFYISYVISISIMTHIYINRIPSVQIS